MENSRNSDPIIYGIEHSGMVPMPIHEYTDDGSDPGNCSVCHFFHTDKRGPNGEYASDGRMEPDEKRAHYSPDGLTIHRGARNVCQECATWQLGN